MSGNTMNQTNGAMGPYKFSQACMALMEERSITVEKVRAQLASKVRRRLKSRRRLSAAYEDLDAQFGPWRGRVICGWSSKRVRAVVFSRNPRMPRLLLNVRENGYAYLEDDRGGATLYIPGMKLPEISCRHFRGQPISRLADGPAFLVAVDPEILEIANIKHSDGRSTLCVIVACPDADIV